MKTPTVMTLDAGGTNFEFSAINNAAEVVKPVHKPSMGHDLDQCLQNIIAGFDAVRKQLDEPPAAISFAFPGPADYEHGIIGDLTNLPGFRGGVALGPMLEDRFGLPVFINNDGDLFTYGEAMHGLLPEINKKLLALGSEKQYKNLSGVTLGTGFGGGFVHNNELMIGDNGAGGEVCLLRDAFNDSLFAEESISARAVTSEYARLSKSNVDHLMPADVFMIAKGTKPGNMEAALDSFRKFGRALGSILAEFTTLMDAPIVVGGGLANAWELFAPEMFSIMHDNFKSLKGNKMNQLLMKTYNLENDEEFASFAKGEQTRIKVPFSEREISYDPMKRIGVGLSRLGTSKAVALGAYAFAVKKIL